MSQLEYKDELEYKPLSDIILDFENPRLSEFGINRRTDENTILTLLWDEMAVNELMYSIVSNGFWNYEPLIVVKDSESEKFIAIEGNRRLAAVKLIHNQELIDRSIPSHIIEKIDDELLEETRKLPVIIVPDREKAWRYIGFKHVNGPAKWGSFAKAKYIAEIHNNFSVPIEQIAYQIGDTNNTAQKLYQGLMVLEQAKKEKVYDYEDVNAKRIYFSHLYTGIQRDGIRNYISLKDPEEESDKPVPDSKKENLRDLLLWLYGSKRDDIQSVIKSQNPDLKYLDEVLQNAEATAALKADEPLSYAHELSKPASAVFQETLLAAKRNLQKARGYVTTAYEGDEYHLKVAGSVANLADDLYDDMLVIHDGLKKKKKGNRISE
ncbi:MAG TPA: hypothetical protein DEA82_06870 [Flavobacteriaceae bacterium]|nr:hypothetical protein [Flavobacteriaceae bacterium]HBR53908.1 hypothetical protein [Flavobacteriaceae bacterium]|tara:strand:- start:837 stop:1973 length:1137 start_codon:yes stop_codon:yes gene_type:complete